MSVTEPPTEVIATITKRMKCWDCLQTKLENQMDTDVCCKTCSYARDRRRNKLMKQKAAGRALRKLAAKINQDPAIVQKPHVMYADVMERLGGPKEFAKMIVEDYLDCREAVPRPRKVLLDYTKAFIAMGLEAQKTAPAAKSTSTMTDDELTVEAARLAQEEMELLLDEERLRLENGTAEDEEEDA